MNSIGRRFLKKTKLFSMILALGVCGIVVRLILSGPVLFKLYYGANFGAICDPPFVILNPFRDKKPERVADRFLSELKNGNLEILNDSVPDAEPREQIRMGEASSKIESWFSASRSQTAERASIEYWIERNYDGGCQSMSAYVDLERINGQWAVTRYSATY